MKKDVLEKLKAQGFAPRTMLDVGAHIGTFTQQFLDVFPGCVPTLIEPNPFCRESLSKFSFETHEVAASHESGRAELFLTKEWLQSTGSSLYRENTAFFRDEVVIKREVDKVRLDDLFRGRQFDFVKIDTQGSELDVLRGGREVLRQADFIVLEVSMVEYNLGGARAEDIFAELTALGFQPTEVTDFHRLRGVHNGNLLQLDFLFERQSRRQTGTSHRLAGGELAGLRDLAGVLEREGRAKDALLLLEHVDALKPGDGDTLRRLARLLGDDGQTLKALQKLAAFRFGALDTEMLADEISKLMPTALKCFNDHAAAGEIEHAEKYASALADLIPGNAALLNSAMSCNLVLGRKVEAERHAAALLKIDSSHAAARAALGGDAKLAADASIEIDRRMDAVLSGGSDTHGLIRLRDMHDLASTILCRPPLDDRAAGQVTRLVEAARELTVVVPKGSEFEGWVKHYRLAIDALDVSMVLGETPMPTGDDEIALVSSSGAALDWRSVRETAKRLGAKTVFFAAADQKYVDLYARWYIKSVLKYADVSCLIVVHVIGGADHLKGVAQSLGIDDERLILAGDRFDAGAVTTKCYDTPPKGLIEVPVAHFQSVRFIRLAALLRQLKLPVFVSDIDLLLQRGVQDLLARCANDDVVFNENTASAHAGSRLTANLLLLNPTDNADLFLRFLRGYLERALGGAEVSRWIDQFGLLMARHHLMRKGRDHRIGYFDTASDINNVMYKSYQDHPFRFLSLYHGFDTSTLEGNPRVHGEQTPKAA